MLSLSRVPMWPPLLRTHNLFPALLHDERWLCQTQATASQGIPLPKPCSQVLCGVFPPQAPHCSLLFFFFFPFPYPTPPLISTLPSLRTMQRASCFSSPWPLGRETIVSIPRTETCPLLFFLSGLLFFGSSILLRRAEITVLHTCKRLARAHPGSCARQ